MTASESTLMRLLAASGSLARALGPARYAVMYANTRIAIARDRTALDRTAKNFASSSFASTKEEARALAMRSLIEYDRTVADFAWAIRMSPKDVRRHTVLRNPGYIDEAGAEGRGSIVAMCHYGSWDFAASIAETLGIPLSVVMNDIGSPEMTAAVSKIRARGGTEIFPVHRAARNVLAALRKGRYVALLCDIPPDGSPTEEVDFCGGKVVFSSAPSWFARHAKAPILPLACYREHGKYVLEAFPPRGAGERTDAQVMQDIAAVFTGVISRDPSQWYPFHDVFVPPVTRV